MNPSHRRYLVNELIRGISDIGPLFESFGQKIADYLVTEDLTHRGLNANGLPVGHTIDSYSASGEIAFQYSAEKNYFEKPFKKLCGDYRHVRSNHPQANRIFLLSAQDCGPKLGTRLTNIRGWLSNRRGISVEVYDSRRIAEFIVDDLLLNDDATDCLSSILGPLARIRDEYAVTNLVPSQSDHYVRQINVIDEVASRIRRDRIAAIAGVSGSGKTETAVAVSNELAKEFDLVVWVVATEVRDFAELKGLDVERRGRRVNIDTLLQERSCLLVLDDLRIPQTVAQMQSRTNNRSAILVTRQIAKEGDYRIPDLDDGSALQILQEGISSKCPAFVLEKVRSTAAGHVLTLRLMNAGVKESSWDDLYADCDAIGEYQDEERVQRLTDRLLGRIRQSLERELAMFLWSGSGRVDRAFARRVIAPVGLRKLEGSCLLSADRHDVIRLHEVVWAALKSTGIPIHRYETEFSTKLETHVQQLAFSPGEALNFLNFCQIHKSHLQRLLSANPKRSSCLYCLAHAWSSEEIIPASLPDPKELSTDLETGAVNQDIDVSAFCELLECLYRRDKLDLGEDDARKSLEQRIHLYSRVAQTKTISSFGRRTVLHHKAKALRNLKRFDDAKELAEDVAREYNSPATNLLLARLLLYGDVSDVERGRKLLLSILESARTNPDDASISVVLASIETLGWGLLNKGIPNALPEALNTYGGLVAEFIMASAARGFDQAFVSFANIGRALRYHDENLFLEVLSSLGIVRPEEIGDDKEREAWGNIYLSASDAKTVENTDEYAILALAFFDSLSNKSDFVVQQMGHAYFRLRRYEDAKLVLSPLVDRKPNAWNRYWLAKAIGELGEFDRAIVLIDEAIEEPKAANFRAALYEQRFELRRKRGDEKAVEDLNLALDVCKDDKHKGSISKKLDELRCRSQEPLA
ncbi:MAG: tetratricopeptide repeat protein [Planctomycetota bacterium]|nr:tetratricopeptide repeat protein [Planctomycetota bacterium]